MRITGAPYFYDAFTGTRWVWYRINEYADSTKTGDPIRSEGGMSQYIAGTNVLSRDEPMSSWDGTNLLPKFNTATAVAPLSFGNTAANIDIICSPQMASGTLSVQGVYGGTGSDNLGATPLCAPSSGLGFTLTSGSVYYCPVFIAHLGPFTKASVRVTTATTSTPGALTVQILEMTPSGVPGKRLINFGNVGSTTGTAPFTLSNTALTTPIWLPPGWYILSLLWLVGSASGTPTLKAMTPIVGPGGISMANNGSIVGHILTGQSAMTDPGTAPNNIITGIQFPMVSIL